MKNKVKGRFFIIITIIGIFLLSICLAFANNSKKIKQAFFEEKKLIEENNYQNVNTGANYGKLSSALEEVASNQTIKVLNSKTETVEPILGAGKTGVKLDINGKTVTLSGVALTNNGGLDIYNGSTTEGKLTGSGARTIINAGTLTTNGTSNTNRLIIENTDSVQTNRVIFNNSNKSLTLNDNTTITFKTATTSYRYLVENNGSLTIQGATLLNSVSGTISDRGVRNAGTGRTIITSGTINTYGEAIFNIGTLTTMPGVEISGTAEETVITTIGTEPSIQNYSTGELLINGGTITSYLGTGINNYAAGKVTVTGGIITGATYGIYNNKAGIITIGTKDSNVNITSPIIQSTGVTSGTGVTINAGTFNFYDGKIIAREEYAINKTVADKPNGYEIAKTTENGRETVVLKSISELKNVILYEQGVENLTLDQINQIWEANTNRSWLFTGTMDKEIAKKYMSWSCKYKSQVTGTSDERGLEDDTDLTITIKDLNINTSGYEDIRVNIDYLSSSTYTTLIKTYSLEVYVYDSNNNSYGPFHLEDFETKGMYMRRSESTEIYERNFNLVTEKINVPNGATITKVEIKPYGNYTRTTDTNIMLQGDYRHADSAVFEASKINIIGYKSSNYKRPEYITYKTIDVNATRENIVKRMYDLATIKWKAPVTFHNTHTIGSNTSAIRATYEVGKIYYGTPYTQINRGTLEKFASKIDNNGTLSEPEDILQVWGNDCGTSVSYSVSKYIPMYTICGTVNSVWDRNKTTLLGNLSIDGKQMSTESLKNIYTAQQIYEAYAQLQKGDVITTHYKSNTHIRLISGNTHVVRNGDGTIDPDASYVIRTDISSSNTDTSEANNFGGLINEQDYVVPFEPKEQFTDIQNLSELEGKNLNYYINKKTTFKELYNTNYIPITFNEYLAGKVEEPYARLINGNTVDNIKDGLKGTIDTNYSIISITYKIEDTITGKIKTFVEYPNHRLNSLEDSYCSNVYSLCYNTSEDVRNTINTTLMDMEDFRFQIIVSAGENEHMEVLNLNKTSDSANSYQNTDTGAYYETLADALNTVASNQTIKVLKSRIETIAPTLSAEKNSVKLNMNGKNISLNGVALTNNGELDIYNGATIEAVLQGSGTRTIINAGALTTNGTSSANKLLIENTTNAPANRVIYNNSGKTITLNKNTYLTFTNAILQPATAGFRALIGNYKGILTIQGATLTNTVSGTTYDRAIINSGAESRTIVTSGIITSCGMSIVSDGAGTTEPTIEITGTTEDTVITTTGKVASIHNSGAGTVQISGGTISSVRLCSNKCINRNN